MAMPEPRQKHDDQSGHVLFDAHCEMPLTTGRPAARRPKYRSDILPPLLFIPLWLATTFGLSALAVALRDVLHPAHIGLPLANTSGKAAALMTLPPMLASCFIAMFVTNFILYHMTRKPDAQGRGGRVFQGNDYRVAQRALRDIGLPIVVITLLLARWGAVLG
jgi:hypothetical protein